MSEQDTDERPEQDAPSDAPSEDNEEVSSSGVELEGFESKNNPSEEREAVMQADSPDDVDDDLLKEIEEERERRLDPDNRPDNVEVDNTKRVFVPAEAKFEDSDIDQDPSLGQEGLAPVGGDQDPSRSSDDSDSTDDSDGSDDSDDSDDSGSSDGSGHAEPDHEEGDPQDDTETRTSGTADPTESDQDGGTARGGRHKA